jgi:hypothetical protein
MMGSYPSLNQWNTIQRREQQRERGGRAHVPFIQHNPQHRWEQKKMRLGHTIR